MEEKHSRLGIASFVTSIAIGILILLLFVVAGILHNKNPDGNYPSQMVVGFVFIALAAADFTAVGLGIASLCQSGRKKIFGILGLIFSSLTLLSTITLIAIGIVFASKR